MFELKWENIRNERITNLVVKNVDFIYHSTSKFSIWFLANKSLFCLLCTNRLCMIKYSNQPIITKPLLTQFQLVLRNNYNSPTQIFVFIHLHCNACTFFPFFFVFLYLLKNLSKTIICVMCLLALNFKPIIRTILGHWRFPNCCFCYYWHTNFQLNIIFTFVRSLLYLAIKKTLILFKLL